MSRLLPDRDGLYHPTTEQQIIDIVRHAHSNDLKVRVLGSLHSVEDSVVAGGSGDINVLLDRYRSVTINAAPGHDVSFTAEGGCNLGVDPRNPLSTEANSLLHQMAAAGCTLPDLGGITHQTVSGFTSTGSSGSTIHHSAYDCIDSLRVIDGTGQVRDLSRHDPDPSRFFAAGVAMGLFGVISKVTLRGKPSFHIRGTESISTIPDCGIDLFGNGSAGRPSLEQYFREKEYVRLLWWPLADPPRVVVWQAKTMQLDDYDDYDDETGPPDNFQRRPYRAFGAHPLIAQAFVFGIQRLVTRRWPPGPRRTRRLNRMLPPIIDRFVPLDDNGPQEFWDDSWRGLPMDNQLNEGLIPLEFTEMKIPLSRTAEVMQALKPHYERHKVLAAGALAVELYPTSSSNFWMNPAYGTEPFLKVDILWFRNRRSDPVATFFPQFWELLEDFNYRLHWGKYLPRPSKAWTKYLSGQYPYWEDWVKLRAEFDPGKVFLSDYWRRHLGI